MPFGAQPAGGAVRFRLWAPACAEVTLLLGRERGYRAIAMRAEADGWHGATVEGVAPGAPYRFPGRRRPRGARSGLAPAARDDVHGPSEVVDPRAYEWPDDAWRGRPWHEAVVYELHVGTFTPEGTFAAARRTSSHYLAELGVTAIELMPLADFPGRRNWGYDGVLPFAPDASYGRPRT